MVPIKKILVLYDCCTKFEYGNNAVSCHIKSISKTQCWKYYCGEAYKAILQPR